MHTLGDWRGPKGTIPARLKSTKRGEIFVLDRRNGQPITPVMERRVPRSTVPGERAAATQPFSTGMPSFAGPPLRERDMRSEQHTSELQSLMRTSYAVFCLKKKKKKHKYAK